MRTLSVVLVAVLLVTSSSRAEELTGGTSVVVLGRIGSVRAMELEPGFLVATVHAEEFLRGAPRDVLEVHLPAGADDQRLAGRHAVLFLEPHEGRLWVAQGRAGLLTSKSAFPAALLDRLRTALAMETHERDADVPEAGVGDITLPKVIDKVKPRLPDAPRRAGVQGKVIMRLAVRPDGQLNDFEVLRRPPPGWGLEAEFVRAVSQWVMEPARDRKDGRPVAAWMVVTIDFDLGREANPGPGPLPFGPREVQDTIAALREAAD